jgi:hypothetical protein
MSDNSISPPNLGSLLLELKDVVDWTAFGIHLEIPYSELKKIGLQNSEIEHCKIAMFATWLDRGTNITWDHVTKALKKIDKVTLADAISNKYSSVINSTTMISPDINVKKSIVEEMNNIETKFAELVVNTQNALAASDKELIRNVLTYIRNLLPKSTAKRLPFSDSPNACEVIFAELSYYWDFLKISPLDEIVKKFLHQDLTLNDHLKNYTSDLDNFKSSTKIRELIDKIKVKRSEKGPTKPVILKLGNMWQDITLEHFESLIKILLDEEEELYKFEVIHGSICIKWYINDDRAIVNKLISRANSFSVHTLRLCQVLYVQIGDDFIWDDNPSIVEDPSTEEIDMAALATTLPAGPQPIASPLPDLKNVIQILREVVDVHYETFQMHIEAISIHMRGGGIIPDEEQSQHTYETIINGFMLELIHQSRTGAMEGLCSLCDKFIASLVSVGGPVEGVANMIRQEWIKSVKEQLEIDLELSPI